MSLVQMTTRSKFTVAVTFLSLLTTIGVYILYSEFFMQNEEQIYTYGALEQVGALHVWAPEQVGAPEQVWAPTAHVPFVYNCSNLSDVINVAVVVTRQNYTSLPLLVLLKSTLVNRHGPLHFYFLSDSTTNKIIHKLLSTWSIPFFEWTVYSTPQTESIPSLVHGTDILLNLLPPTVKEFIVLCIDALVIKDLGQLWQYLKQQHHESSRVPTIADDFQLNVLLIKHHDNIDSSDTRNEYHAGCNCALRYRRRCLVSTPCYITANAG